MKIFHYDWNLIYYWLNLHRKIFIASIWCIILMFGYYLDLSSVQKSKWLELKAQQNLKLELAQTIAAKNSLLYNINQLDSYATILNKWNKKIVTHKDQPEILQQIVNLINLNHLINKNFDPWEEVRAQFFYHKIEIKLTLLGTFLQLATFMDQVIHLPKLAVIEKFSIKSSFTDSTTSPTNSANISVSSCALDSNCQHELDLNLVVYSNQDN